MHLQIVKPNAPFGSKTRSKLPKDISGYENEASICIPLKSLLQKFTL